VAIREGGPRGRALAGLVGGTCVLLALALAPSSLAATIEVTPGPSAINKALNQAHNGDTLRIHDGTYREAFTVDKRVTLRGVGGRPLIDSRCKSRTAIKVTHGGVGLYHLKVIGAAENPSGLYPSELDVENVGTGTIFDLVVHDSCGGTDVGAEYGINVFNSGALQVRDNRATGGFSDAGIYIGGITHTGTEGLRVRDNEAFGNHQGVIVENSAGGRIVVAHNRLHDNTIGGEELEPTGLFINNSDRVVMFDNSIKRNGHFGINISAGSDHNSLTDNTVTGNPIDLNNDGTANCGSANTIGTTTGTPLSSCG
jgi:parallel beta-helix repeat protein